MKDRNRALPASHDSRHCELALRQLLLGVSLVLLALGSAGAGCNSETPARRGTDDPAAPGGPTAGGGGAGESSGAGGSTAANNGGGGTSGGTGGAKTTPAETGGSGGADPGGETAGSEQGGSPPATTADASTDAAVDGAIAVIPGTPFETSCDKQKCESGETCVEGGYGGTYCAKPCPGQRNCPSGTAYCERNGGVICVKK